jgi:hypothetical protein
MPRPSRLSRSCAVLLAAALIGCGGASAAEAPSPSCAPQPSSPWQGNSAVTGVTLPAAAGGGSYQALLFTPPATKRFPGRRPGVVLMHGAGGDQCSQWWEARALAGHGYVALSLGRAPTDSLDAFVQEVRSGVRYLRSAANPAARRTNRNRIGLTAHSLGTPAIAIVQQDEPGVRAIASLDSLSSVYRSAPKQPLQRAHPKVPALGESADSTYPRRMNEGIDPYREGYGAWRQAHLPAMEVVFRGFVHNDFAAPGPDAKHQLEAHYVVAWFDRWLLGRRSAAKRLVARTVDGQPLAAVLSAAYRSSVSIPRQVSCSNLVACHPHVR